VLGPKRLPEVMKTVGKMMAELRKASEEVKKEIIQTEDMKEIQDSLREISDVPRLVQAQLEREVADLEAQEKAKENPEAKTAPDTGADAEPVKPEGESNQSGTGEQGPGAE